MRISHQSRAGAICAGALYALSFGAPVIADDTEIFFGGVSATAGAIYPNVLFVLDTSSSMNQTVTGTGMSRLDNMKQALDAILSGATNINVGLMRFSRAGGPVLFPVSYIDQDVCEVEPCTTSGPDIQVRVSDSNDDAEEDSSGNVNLTSTDLEMVNDPALSGGTETTVTVYISDQNDDMEENQNGSAYLNSSDLELVDDGSRGDQKIGLRFRNVAVPQGALITQAELEFTVDENESGTISLDVYGHYVDDSPGFDSSSNQVTNRISSAATSKIDWDNLPNPGIGSKLTSPDIKLIVQEIVNRPGWSSGNDMGFMLEKDPASPSGNSNKRTVDSYSESGSGGTRRPALRITYTSGSGLGNTSQTIGLRFQDVQIPQGVTITSASLEFEVDETDTETTNLTIQAEASDDAAAFADSSNDITSRITTANSVAWSNIPAWDTVDVKQQSPDITAIVQEIVNRSGWCGGNAMGFVITGTGKRTAKSYDGAPGDAPLLKVSYDPDSVPASGGCLNQTITKTISTGNDDAEELVSNGSVNLSSTDLELVNDNGDQVIGIRFQNLAIPQGATIISADLQFEVDEPETGTISLNIYGEDTDDAAMFTSSTNNISSRTKTTASVAWSNVLNPAVDQKLNSPDITAIVQEIVNRAAWTSGNDLAFIIEKASGSGKRTVESYNGEPIAAARLTVQIQYDPGASGGQGALLTVRDRLKQEVSNLEYKSGTPIVDTLYEAALYFRGEDILYGKQRGNSPTTTSRSEYTRVSHPSSYLGGSVSRDAGCTDANLNSTACKSEIITGSPTYVSPITETCQGNYMVFLSDGEPSYNESADEVQALAGISSCANSGNAACGPELAKFLYEQDQTTLDGTQNVVTYTIGFNLDGGAQASAIQYLQDIAGNGGGSFFEASTATDLTNVFQSILKEILKVDTTFVSPGATVNQFNRLTHRNDIYFSLFKPDDRPKWAGNLKRYELAGNPTQVVDQNGAAAVDPASGFFKSTAQSTWSALVDGNDISLGGAAGMLSLTGRNVYTYTGTSTSLTDSTNALHENTTELTKAMLGINSQSDAYRTSLLQWARGVDIKDVDEDGSTTDVRLQLGDPLHSRPVIVTYGGTDASPDSTIFFGTNEGFIHAVDADDGTEVFSFIPQELLPNLDLFFANSTATSHPYGLDGAITVWVKDVNGNNQIEPLLGDHVYLYVGMRRGGRNYYALDMSDRASPSLLWTIKGGVTGTDFAELGESWSRPVFSRVKLNGTVREVLIFAGGYDNDQDTYTVRTQDTQGRAIYMVDAASGALIWSGGVDVSNDEVFSDMIYSIPSDMRVIDINGDGLVDQMYVGDMGGQVWRFDLDNSATAAADLVTGGVIAQLSGATTDSNRRFYYPPDVALLNQNGTQMLSISVGSGWRAHPLDTVVQDRFYMLSTQDVFSAPSSYTVLTESNDLYDATANLIGEGDTTQQATATAALNSKQGWYIRLENSGEKVLASSLTINNQILFTTYEPSITTSSCTAAQGGGRVYVVSVFDATPTLNLNGVGTDTALTKGDRSGVLDRGGIPPEAIALFPDGSDPIVLVGPEQPLDDLDFGNLTGRTFWQEVSGD